MIPIAAAALHLQLAACCPQTGVASGLPQTIASDSLSFKEEAAALRPTSVRFGPPFEEGGLTVKARSLRERLEVHTSTHPLPHLERDWMIAVDESFVLSCISEWNSFASCEQGLKRWWRILEADQFQKEKVGHDLSLRLTSYCLQSWGKTEPERAFMLMKEADKRFGSSASDQEKFNWKWWTARHCEQLEHGIENVSAPNRDRFEASLAEFMDSYDDDTSLPLATRTQYVCSRARRLYSAGNSKAAASVLEGWWKRHHGKIQAPEFFALSFHVTHAGLGDRKTARAMLSRATELVAKEVISEHDGYFIGMVRAYYRDLPFTDLELARKSARYRTERTTLAKR